MEELNKRTSIEEGQPHCDNEKLLQDEKKPHIKYLKAIVNLAIAAVVLVLAIVLLPRMLSYFIPFVLGWIIAMIASPLVRFFEDKVKIKRKAGSAVVIIVVIGLVVLVLYLVGSKLVKEVGSFVRELPNLWQSMEEQFIQVGKNMEVVYDRLPADFQQTVNEIGAQASSYVSELISSMGSPTITAVGNFARQLPSIIIGVIMCLLSSYLFVAERHGINNWFKKHMPSFVQTRFMMLKNSLWKAVGGYFKAQLKIEIWVYIVLLIGFTILRIDYAILIAFGIALLDFLPFFGTGAVMVPWAIVEILGRDYRMAIGILIIWGVGQLLRQLIQPKYVGDSIGVAPLPTLFLLYIGFRVAGVMGLIFSVPLGLIIYTMYEEGAFDTTKKSIQILIAGINHFRRLEDKDMEVVNEMQEAQAKEKERLIDLPDEGNKPPQKKKSFFKRKKN